MTRPYGKIDGIVWRMADWLRRVKNDKALPWIGSGLVADMELMVRLTSLEEFGQWLRTHSDDDLQRWGVEVLDAAGDRDELLELMGDIEDSVPVPEGATYSAAVKAAGEACDGLADVRAVLVETGALAADDTTTNVAELVRALLS